MQKERTTLKVAALANNTGQLGWLPSNPRQWTQTDIDRTAKSLTNDPDFLEDRPLLALRDGKGFIIFAGNLRLTAARKLKLKEVPGIIYTPESDEDRETIKRRSILDNGSFGAWDYDALANEWDDLALADWGVPAWNPAEEDDGPLNPGDDLENPYSTKMEAPIYEIRGEKPTEDEVVDTTKVDELLAGIEAADIPGRVKEMLRVCAYRHAVIDFELMAEYYAHAPKEVQELMEDNALVIIDFDKAVANGFVKMSHDLQAIYDKNTELLYGKE